MQNLARKLESRDVSQEIGRVVRTEGSGAEAKSDFAVSPFKVRAQSGDYEAKRAVSCLVEPVADDVVLLALAPNGAAYILAVLERDEGARATIRVEGDLEFKLPHGRFTVAAQEGVDLVTGKDVGVVAAGFRVNAAEASVVVQSLSFLGGFVRSEIEKVKFLAGTFDSVLERFSQKVKRSYRTVEEIDQVRAQTIDYTAKSTMSLHGENALLTAEELVKVDGEQIHLG